MPITRLMEIQSKEKEYKNLFCNFVEQQNNFYHSFSLLYKTLNVHNMAFVLCLAEMETNVTLVLRVL